jgi:F-type H+-transporting ATPase subunit b
MFNFLLLIFLLNAILYRPIRKILAEREEKVDGLTGDIESSRENRSEALADFEANMAQARKDGYEKLQEFKDEGYSREKEIIEAEHKKSEEKLKEMVAAIEKDMDAARSQLSEQVKTFSVEVTEKILGRSI